MAARKTTRPDATAVAALAAAPTKVTSITPAAQVALSTAAIDAVRAALAPFGVDVKVTKNMRTVSARGAQDADYMDLAFQIAVAGDADTPAGKDATVYRANAAMDGLDPAWLGKDGLSHPTLGAIRIWGYRTRGKAPIIVRQMSTGKDYLFTVEQVKMFAKAAGWPLPAHWTNDPKLIQTGALLLTPRP